MVSRSMADVLDVAVFSAGAHTFLTRCRAGIGPLFFTEENGFKLYHAGVHKEKGRVTLRDERRARHNPVVL